MTQLKNKKKILKVVLTANTDTSGSAYDNPVPQKLISSSHKPDKEPKKQNTSPPLDDLNERGDISLSNLQSRTEGAQVKKLKEWNKVKK
jgi:hypothetical protein